MCGGTPRERTSVRSPQRSIPACAGEPPRRTGHCPGAAVYPRVCGGTLDVVASRVVIRGLSPRVRGNLLPVQYREYLRRSIPACAGEPRAGPTPRKRMPVYPRVCGGTLGLGLGLWTLQGLSPRVRGNLYRVPAQRDQVGSIPACAGNPRKRFHHPSLPGSIPACAGEPGPWLSFKTMMPVYPRVCGGTRRRLRRTPGERGLSPRVRGNPSWSASMRSYSRSIPACAGEPSGSGPSDSGSGVYPRVCGGTRAEQEEQWRVQGLSPRVRGNRGVAPWAVTDRGSIPACAGEPRRADHVSGRGAVYPRVCGGTLSIGGYLWRESGLSPRVRGNPGVRPCRRGRDRSIPACAGEPP